MIDYKISRCLALMAFAVALASRAPAQPFTVLADFNPSMNTMGSHPQAPLAQGPDGTLYGVTTAGGEGGFGTVFKTQPDGTGFTVLWNFSGEDDGGDPVGGLLLSSNTLYGTTYSGGSNGFGTVFSVGADGSGFTTLHTFAGSPNDGANSSAALALSGNTLYGTAYNGGASSVGIIFSVNTDGTGFTNMHSFTAGLDCGNPYAGMVLSGGILYGTTSGSSSLIQYYGSVFKINPDGSGFTVLKTFEGGDGANPYGPLLVSGGELYGTTDSGTPGYGTVFKLGVTGSGFTTLYSFSGGADGNAPYGPLALLGGALYGTTLNRGAYGDGTIFKVNATSGGFAVLKSFTGGDDGGEPYGGLLLSGGNLYGTTANGGTNGNGTLFRITTSGAGFVTRATFDPTEGGNSPQGQLALSGAALYGTTSQGGAFGEGTIFTVNTAGGELATLHSFNGSDGESPRAGLLLSGGILYGTTYSGGSDGYGSLFSVNTNGAGFTNLYYFNNTQGAFPEAALILADGILFGTTYGGGSNGSGTLFRINTDGSGFTNLYDFTATTWNGTNYTNVDGANPSQSLAFLDGALYGSAPNGGVQGAGTLFRIDTDGSGFTNLHSFTATSGYPNYTNSDGASPVAGLTVLGDTLYGTTSEGGPADFGTIFKITTNNAFTVLASLTTSGAKATLTLGADGNFYCTTGGGGINGNGTIFEATTNGAVSILVSLNSVDGAQPGGLTFGADGVFYGAAFGGGAANAGTVFRFSPFAPFITTQPKPATQFVPAGANVTISSGATGLSPLFLQWTFNGTNLPGETNAVLTLTNVNLPESGLYALQASNSLGVVFSSNAVLTVVPALVTTLPPSGISANAATLNGSVTLGAVDTAVWFDWGTDTNYGSIAGFTNLPGADGTFLVASALSELSVTSAYHYRCAASNIFGVVYGNDELFQVGVKPLAITLAATDATKTSATLNGSVNPNGLDTTAYFQWGTSASSLNNRTVATNLGGSAPLNLEAPVTGLNANLTYYYQIVASNSLGATYGSTLFFSPGPWAQTTAPIHNWDSIAASADGSTLVAVGYDTGPGGPIYTSTNFGVTWISNSAPIGPWESVACSADGRVMVAAGGGGNQVLGPIYLSTNSGATWAPTSAPSNNWFCAAASADGTKLVVVDSIGQRIYQSTDTGITWAQTTAPAHYWSSVASSADGTRLVAVSGNYSYLSHPPGPIYTSTNSGVSWISNSVPLQHWSHVSSSADGNTLLAVAGGNNATGPVYTSTNAGKNWVLRSAASAREWIFSAVSADGTRMAAAPIGAFIYTSTNSGATWTPNSTPPLDWNAVAFSADGAFLAASVGYPGTGGIYVYNSTPAPVLSLAPSDGNATISWVIPSASFALQQSSDLSNWTEVTNQPALNLSNLQNQLALPASDNRQFYRLKNQ